MVFPQERQALCKPSGYCRAQSIVRCALCPPGAIRVSPWGQLWAGRAQAGRGYLGNGGVSHRKPLQQGRKAFLLVHQVSSHDTVWGRCMGLMGQSSTGDAPHWPACSHVEDPPCAFPVSLRAEGNSTGCSHDQLGSGCSSSQSLGRCGWKTRWEGHCKEVLLLVFSSCPGLARCE